MNRRRAFTIIELLVTMTLVVAVFTIAYNALLPSLRIWAINQGQANLEQTGEVLEARMLSELKASTRQSLTTYAPAATPASPDQALRAVSFASTGPEFNADSFDPMSGMPLWQFFVVYYAPAGSHTIYRRMWPDPNLPAGSQVPPCIPMGQLSSPPPGALPYMFPTWKPVPLTQGDLVLLCSTLKGAQPLGSSVMAFQVTGQGSLNATLTIGLEARGPKGLLTSNRSQEFNFRM